MYRDVSKLSKSPDTDISNNIKVQACRSSGLSADSMCWECRELFKSLDTDASNTIEAKELADGLKAQGYNISQQELAQLMGRVDFDRNGTLDLEEFISGLIDWTEVELNISLGWEACAVTSRRLLGTEAFIMAPNGIDISFLFFHVLCSG